MISGRQIGYSKEGARMLEGMIRQVNQNIQKRFKISRPNFLKMSKVQNFGKKKSTFLGRLNKLQGQYGLKDTDTLGHVSFIFFERVCVTTQVNNLKLILKQIVNLLIWLIVEAFFDKSYSIPQIRKDFKDNPKVFDWVLDTDKKITTKCLKIISNHLKYCSFKLEQKY